MSRSKTAQKPGFKGSPGSASLSTVSELALPLPLKALIPLDQQLSSYDYHLPETLIAQNPVIPRDISRLFVVQKNQHQHQSFADIQNFLKPGDLLVMNNSKVIPARLKGHKVNPHPTNARGSDVEALLLEPLGNNQWLSLVKPGRRLKPGAQMIFGADSPNPLKAEVIATDEATRGRVLQFHLEADHSLMDLIDQHGEIPLPPYIQNSQADPDQYQTVYAEHPGSVAAPTAGLHFTPELLANLEEQGIRHEFVTLHVGIGTFRPVEVENITDHDMHAEWIQVPEKTKAAIAETKANGGRVIAVGTTSVRSLESMGNFAKPEDKSFEGKSELFIYPGYQWTVVDGLITNFHLPKSSLLMLVSALIGRERLLTLYEEAIAEKYRFFSFGDAMFITPEAKLN